MKLSYLLAILSIATVSCSVSNKVEKSTTKTDGAMQYAFFDMGDKQVDMIEKNNAFVFDLFKNVSGHDSKVVSPISVTCLIGMLANGADGQTRQEMLNMLGWNGQEVDDVNKLCNNVISLAGHSDGAVELDIANYVGVSNNEKLKEEFKKSVDLFYKGKVESLDFRSAKSVERINSWCNSRTKGMIPKLLNGINPQTTICAVNAIYFNGTWKDKFDSALTRKEVFNGYTKDIKKVDMMHRNGTYRYYEGSGFSAVAMPYNDGQYEMLAFLPFRGVSMDDVLDSLKANGINSIRRNMATCDVDLKLPRFSIETEQPLNQVISNMGSRRMFTDEAEFNNLVESRSYVSEMKQKAKIEVSEEGTKAAAATYVQMVGMTAFTPKRRQVEFHANRPFLYAIIEKSSGTIFFIGQYVG